ncbi:SPOSA6832_02867, partial [Sporobolomyces salmonicolor]
MRSPHSSPPHPEDRTPLLAGSALDDDVETSVKPDLREGEATVMSCIANLAREGLIPGVVMVVVCGGAAWLGLYFLTRSAAMAPHRAASFSSLSKLTFPGLARLFDFAVALKCFGVSISYLIVIGGLMPKVVRSFNPSLTDSIFLDRRLWILASMTLLCPLAFLRRLDSLKMTSYIALCSIAYLNTQARLNLVIGTSIGSAAAICEPLPRIESKFASLTPDIRPDEILGSLGYLAFGAAVGGNIIEMYPHTTLVSIGQLGIVVLVLFSYPLQLHPARASLDKFLFPHPTPSDDDDTLVDDHAGGDDIPLGRFVLESSLILFATFCIAMFVSSLETVLGFVGATGSTTISFILPSIFCTFQRFCPVRSQEEGADRKQAPPANPVLALFKDSPSPKDRRLRWAAVALLSWGLIVMVLSLGMNICASLHTLGYLGGKSPSVVQIGA